jgi:hypothetical protein
MHCHEPDALPISPELALVSPDDAERARALLPPPGVPIWLDRVAAEPEAEPEPAATQPQTVGPAAARHEVLVWTAERFLPSMVAGAAAVVATVALTALADAVRPGVESSAATTQLVQAAPKAAEKARAPAPVVHVLRWRARPGAAFYDVQVFRGSKKVLEAWPAIPRLDLPKSWTFGNEAHRLEAGTYRWFAWPAYFANRKPRYGAPIVRSTFTVHPRALR